MTSMKPQIDSGEEYFTAFNILAKRCPELARDFLWRLLDSIARSNSRIVRELVTMVLLALAFELLNRNLVGEATAFGFKAAKIGFLRYWIPVAIAFLLFHVFLTRRDRNFSAAVLDAICDRTYPDLERSGLLNVIKTSSWVLTSLSPPPSALISQKSMIYRKRITTLEILIFAFVIPIGFTGYSIIQLFRQSKSPHIAPIIVAVLTMAILVAAYILYITSANEAKIPGRIRQPG